MALPSNPPANTTPAAYKTWAQAVVDTAVDHESRIDDLEGGEAGFATDAELAAEAALARNADNLTSGTVADARIASTIARDSEVTAAVAALSSVYQPLDGDLTALASAGNSAVLAASTASFLTADETKLDALPNAATYASDLAGKQPIDSDLTALAAAGNSAVLSATTASFLTAQDTKLNALPTAATYASDLALKANVVDTIIVPAGLLGPSTSGTVTLASVPANRSPAWSLPDSSANGTAVQWLIPSHWTTFSVTVRWFTAGASSTGNVYWRRDFGFVTVGDNVNTDFASGSHIAVAEPSQYILTDTVLAGSAISNVPGQIFTGVALRRGDDGANDTCTNPVYVTAMILTKVT